METTVPWNHGIKCDHIYQYGIIMNGWAFHRIGSIYSQHNVLSFSASPWPEIKNVHTCPEQLCFSVVGPKKNTTKGADKCQLR